MNIVIWIKVKGCVEWGWVDYFERKIWINYYTTSYINECSVYSYALISTAVISTLIIHLTVFVDTTCWLSPFFSFIIYGGHFKFLLVLKWNFKYSSWNSSSYKFNVFSFEIQVFIERFVIESMYPLALELI